jgi:hypothetical protein
LSQSLISFLGVRPEVGHNLDIGNKAPLFTGKKEKEFASIRCRIKLIGCHGSAQIGPPTV